MFEVGDKVKVNLGKNGTHVGELVSEENGGQKLLIILDNGQVAEVAPWDVSLAEETES